MDKLPDFKRGESFAIGFLYKDEQDEPIDLTAIDIKSQIRTDKGTLVVDLTCQKLNQVTNKGQASIYALTAEETLSWPIGLLFCDIKLSIGNQSVLTETFWIPCIKEITE